MAIPARFKAMLGTSALALILTGCAGSATKQSTGDVIDDGMLTARVKTALMKDPDVKGTSVNVDTFKGTVQLSGFVSSDLERTRAGQVARQVNGVAEVRNNLEVKGR